MLSNGGLLSHLSQLMSLGKPHGVWSSGDSSKIRISSKLIEVLELWGRNLLFLIDLAIGLYKIVISQQIKEVIEKTRMWVNAQRDGRPTEHRWRRT